MDYVILCTEDRRLIQTSPLLLYKGEENYDTFKLLFPTQYAHMTPLIQMILADGTGKEFQCNYSYDDYKGKKIVELQISKEMLLTDGDIQLWATLSDANSLVKTSKTKISVLNHDGFGQIIPDTEIQPEIENFATAILGKAVLNKLVLGRK